MRCAVSICLIVGFLFVQGQEKLHFPLDFTSRGILGVEPGVTKMSEVQKVLKNPAKRRAGRIKREGKKLKRSRFFYKKYGLYVSSCSNDLVCSLHCQLDGSTVNNTLVLGTSAVQDILSELGPPENEDYSTTGVFDYGQLSLLTNGDGILETIVVEYIPR